MRAFHAVHERPTVDAGGSRPYRSAPATRRRNPSRCPRATGGRVGRSQCAPALRRRRISQQTSRRVVARKAHQAHAAAVEIGGTWRIWQTVAVLAAWAWREQPSRLTWARPARHHTNPNQQVSGFGHRETCSREGSALGTSRSCDARCRATVRLRCGRHIATMRLCRWVDGLGIAGRECHHARRGYGKMIRMQSDLLTLAECNRIAALSRLDPKRQDTLGQFFTPQRAAALIASMPRLPEDGRVTVLDPGAGSGMLSAALVARALAECPDLSMHLVAVECDEAVVPQLMDTLEACKVAGGGRVTFEVIHADFITASTGLTADERLVGFDLVIQNPPYAKLSASSPARAAIRQAGSDAPNLYAAFLALAARALNDGGQLVAITPRSFCNGPYFGLFRSCLLDQIALDRVHMFESRSKVFADTGVLQENVIFSGTKNGSRQTVLLSTSNGHEDDASHRHVLYTDVVHPDDPHRFVRIAANDEDTAIAERMMLLPDTLASVGVTVSTGRVVDFRSRPCLHTDSLAGGAPLIYPGNIRDGVVLWPREIRKAQWFAPITETDEKMLVPEGWYCVVKRFSAKEERRRIVAAVWSPETRSGPVAFENHINVFHLEGEGLDRNLAYGLSAWLNSSLVDRFFRTFSGHTQVNAADLRTMPFPSAEQLRQMGRSTPERLQNQEQVDAIVERVFDTAEVAA